MCLILSAEKPGVNAPDRPLQERFGAAARLALGFPALMELLRPFLRAFGLVRAVGPKKGPEYCDPRVRIFGVGRSPAAGALDLDPRAAQTKRDLFDAAASADTKGAEPDLRELWRQGTNHGVPANLNRADVAEGLVQLSSRNVLRQTVTGTIANGLDDLYVKAKPVAWTPSKGGSVAGSRIEEQIEQLTSDVKLDHDPVSTARISGVLVSEPGLPSGQGIVEPLPEGRQQTFFRRSLLEYCSAVRLHLCDLVEAPARRRHGGGLSNSAHRVFV